MFLFKGTRTIKLKDGEKNIKVIGYTTSSKEDLQEILTPFSIVIISYLEHSEPLGKNFEIRISNDKKSVDIIFPLVNEQGKIREAFNEFVDMFGIVDIDYIKPYGIQIEEEKLKAILKVLKQEYKERKGLKAENKETELLETESNVIIDKRDLQKLNDLKKDINEFIQEMKELIEKAKNIYPVGVRELESLINELLKYRNTTNIYKIAEIYKEALEKGDQVYKKYFDYLEKKEKEKASNKIISEIDILAEYSNWAKAQRAKQLEKVDAKEYGFPWYEVIFYKIFGKFGINLKLILKEFIEKYKLNYYSFADVLTFFQFLLIFLVIDYYVLFLYKRIILSKDISSLLPIFYVILIISSGGIIITLGKIISRRSTTLSIISMVILFIIFYFIKSYFAF